MGTLPVPACRVYLESLQPQTPAKISSGTPRCWSNRPQGPCPALDPLRLDSNLKSTPSDLTHMCMHIYTRVHTHFHRFEVKTLRHTRHFSRQVGTSWGQLSCEPACLLMRRYFLPSSGGNLGASLRIRDSLVLSAHVPVWAGGPGGLLEGGRALEKGRVLRLGFC